MIEDKNNHDIIETDNPLAAFESVEIPQPTRKKTISNARSLIAAVAIVAVLAILLAILLPLLNTNNAGSSDVSSNVSADEQVYPMYDHSKDDTKEKIVQSIAIQHKNETYTVYYNDKEKAYLLRGYEDLRLSDTVEELMESATVLNGYDRVQHVEKLADFGLETPAYTVAITYHNDDITTLYIGNETPDKNGYYAYVNGNDTVFMVNSDTMSLFMQTKGALVETTILAAPTVRQDDQNGSAILKEFTIIGGQNKTPLSMRQAEKSDGVEHSYTTYIVTKPYRNIADETIGQQLESFTQIIAAEATVLHPTAADKKSYGFDKPYAVAQLTLAVQSVKEDTTPSSGEETEPETYYYNTIQSTVTVGSKDKDGNYYVMIDDHNAIYHVAASMLSPIIERTYDNTVGKLLFLKNITEIGKIAITADSQDYPLTLTHYPQKENADEKLVVTHHQQTLSTSNFRLLYSHIMGISRYGMADAAPNGQPQHRIALYENDGSLFLSLELYKQSASLYTARTNEGELFTIKSSSINNWLTQLNNFLTGKEVAELQ